MKVPIEVEDERDDERHEAAEASEAEAGRRASFSRGSALRRAPSTWR